MKIVEYAIWAVILCSISGLMIFSITIDDTQPHEKNARERGELQASFYTPKPDIIEGE